MGLVDIQGVEHFGAIVADTESLALWYRDVFGAREVSRSEDSPPIIFLDFGGGSLLELVPGKAPENQSSDHVHLSFAVDSMDKSVSVLQQSGISLEKPVFKAYDGSPVAFLRDPEGNLVQLVERLSGLPRPR